MRVVGRLLFRKFACSCYFYHSDSTTFGFVPERRSTFDPYVSNNITPEESQKLHLINAYRRYGYLKANLDPLNLSKPPAIRELNPEVYGLKLDDKNENGVTVEKLIAQLEALYCGPIAVEFMHLNDWEERHWFSQMYEKVLTEDLSRDDKQRIVKLMLKSQNFDNFLALKFPTLKRYGCEGAESMFAFFSEIFEQAPQNELSDICIAIAHRGRLNLLAELMEFPVVQMFRKAKGKKEFPDDVQGSGDVMSHFTSSFDYSTLEGKVHITMLPNPSHLEAVNPVAVGKARAKAAIKRIGDYGSEKDGAQHGDSILCLQVHGDGAFSGQGVVWETNLLSQCPHFRIGGSVHLITNNQIAFTAEAHIGRSSVHCTDIAKSLPAPVIHVNGDSPEDLVRATRLALAYRQRFRKDVFINLICYRRWGHNELDDPSFTQPLMYQKIEARESVPDLYCKQLIQQEDFSEDERKKLIEEHTNALMKEFKEMDKAKPRAIHLGGNWKGMKQAPKEFTKWDTGVEIDLLKYIGAKSVEYPKDSFNIHPHLQKTHCEARITKIKTGENIDWSTAEALAFGSILVEGNDVRISGQDVGRATFSHRHVTLVDQKNDNVFIPLNNIHEDQKNFIEVANNPLSEEAVLGFEFGFSLENPKLLTIWEAQFGDFFNTAQVIIDTFIASAESKWLQQSGLVINLPHGFDGAGPEHSSCRMERFLQLTDSREDQNPPDGDHINIHIANPTTSAQYFHLLRRQIVTPWRKPLVIVAPKILLRHSKAASKIHEFAPGTFFQPVLDDPATSTDPSKIKKLILTSGKHAYALMKERDEKKLNDTAIIRVEGLAPFPLEDLRKVLQRYSGAQKYIWSQEEPRNAGAYTFMSRRIENSLGISVAVAARPELAHTATAIGEIHEKEHNQVIADTFAF
uniref:Transketolase-like pyrimidine-binding domain-containing protein n=1 Tax=Panagrolaimus sp. PS1159 TaxID=55785 RepID=A0AC35FBU2_9BILA